MVAAPELARCPFPRTGIVCAIPQAAGAEVAQKGASLEQLRGRLAELRDAVSSERNQSAVMNALQQALESGHIPGIYGRLGDLAGIDGMAPPLRRQGANSTKVQTSFQVLPIYASAVYEVLRQ